MIIPILIEDLWKYRVPNSIILVGLVAGLVTNVVEMGVQGVWFWCTGVIVPVVMLWALFLIKVMGAGDIKLFSIIGGFFGISFIFKTIIIAFCIGGIMSVFQLLRYHNLMNRLQYLASFSSKILKTKRIEPYYLAERDGRTCVIHFSVAIAVSVFIIWRRWI